MEIYGNFENIDFKKALKAQKKLNSWDTRMMNDIIFDWKQTCNTEKAVEDIYTIYNYRGYIPSTGG